MMAENIEGSAENNILEVEDDSELKRKAMEKYTAFLETLDSNFKIPEIFNQNFMEGWREIMTEEERKIIGNLDECNFRELKEYFLQKKANDKLPPKHGSHLNYDKKAQKKKNVQLMINYGFCMMDGQKHELVKFKIKPPELYRHKAKNPNIGKLRHRIRPEDVIINCRYVE